MASAKKCDRCKQYYDKDEHSVNGLLVGKIELRSSEAPGKSLSADLCPDCMLKFIDFMDFPETVLCRPLYGQPGIIGYEEVKHYEKNETNA